MALQAIGISTASSFKLTQLSHLLAGGIRRQAGLPGSGRTAEGRAVVKEFGFRSDGGFTFTPGEASQFNRFRKLKQFTPHKLIHDSELQQSNMVNA